MNSSKIKKYIAIISAFAFLQINIGDVSYLASASENCTVTESNISFYKDDSDMFLKYAEDVLNTDLDISDDGTCQASGSSQEMYGNFGTDSTSSLNSNEKIIYNSLKTELMKVANGTVSDATFVVSGFSVTGSNANETFTKNISHRKIIDYLLIDMPYELYWFDKVTGYKLNWSASLSGGIYTVNSVSFSFIVSKDYSVDGKTSTTIADVNKTGAVTKTAATAMAVVNANAGKSDYEKLVAYRDYICSQVDYNHAAVNNNYAYGDPWQLVYAFDNNPSTNIVCEGYSKAFQYLCELSSFSGNVVCRSVIGSMGGPHMWNVVTIDGKNYLVDITNCDSGAIGYPDNLFLKGMSGTVSGGYSKKIYSQTVKYTYDSTMTGVYGTSALTLSSTDYGVSGNSEQQNPSQPATPSDSSPSIKQSVNIVSNESSSSLTGIGAVAGWVDTDVINVVLPVQSLDFKVDPYGIIKKSNAAKYPANTYFEYNDKEDGFVFFRNVSNSGVFYSPDICLSVYNRSSCPLNISVLAEFTTSDGSVLIDSDGVYQKSDLSKSLSFSITDLDKGQKSFIQSLNSGASLENHYLIDVSDAYSFKYTGRGYEYSLDESSIYSAKNPYGTIQESEYTILLSADCNPYADWTGVNLKGSKLSVVWQISKV